jgi:hypothetical protein
MNLLFTSLIAHDICNFHQEYFITESGYIYSTTDMKFQIFQML